MPASVLSSPAPVRVRRLAATGVAMAAVAAVALMPAAARGQSRPSAGFLAIGGGSRSAASLRSTQTGPPYGSPPTIAQCRADRKNRSCYGPKQLQHAYGVDKLIAAGVDGRGTTIAIVDPFGSPTALADLKKYDRDFGLPDPPSFKVITPVGAPPPFDKNDDDQTGWAGETTLDIQLAHAMAPGANILLVESPVTETEGTVGFPEIVAAENYVINHHLAQVITQSFGASEATFKTKQSLLNLRSAFINAKNHGVTVLASSGDSGVTDVDVHDNYVLKPTDGWPSSDPLVTSVGGTELHLNVYGTRYAPDTVWNQTDYYQDAVAGGGGPSAIFARPAFQNGVAGVVGARRGTPDVSLSASTNGGAIVYQGFYAKGSGENGYSVYGGTSASSPTFAGIVALADQVAGHSLGYLNPQLYALSAADKKAALPDITAGDNTVTFTGADNKSHTVKGYSAVPGYDMASGLGSIWAPAFVAAMK
jgi:subtilase family serine protease